MSAEKPAAAAEADAPEDPRRPYTVDLGGLAHTLLLTPEAAKQYPGAKPVDEQPKARKR